MRLRLSGRQKAVLAIALGLLLFAPTGISHEEGASITTGHSTFYNGDGYDQCLGSLAGILRSRVMWFNDQVLVERYGGKGQYIMITEHGAPDPRGKHALYTEGVFYDLVDPNGAHWHIEEAWYVDGLSPYVSSESEAPDPMDTSISNAKVGTEYNASVVKDEDKYYVWFVELSANPIFDEFAGDDPHSFYNFLVIVDTCKMNKERIGAQFQRVVEHNNQSGVLNDRNGHPNGAAEHEHENFVVDLWISRKPQTIPFGEISTNPTYWQSGWAAQYPQQAQAAANDSDENSVPDGFGSALP